MAKQNQPYQLDPRSLKQALAAFEEFPRAVRVRHLRIAINAAASVQRTEAIKLAPRRTSLLAKSLAIKAKVPLASRNPKHHTKPAWSVVGANKAVVRAAANVNGKRKVLTDRQATKRVLSGKKVTAVKPKRYAHLAENRGKSPSRFLSRSATSTRRAAVEAARQKLQIGAEAEARKLAAKSGVK